MINTATVTHNEYFMKRRREMADKLGYFYGHTGMPEYHNLQLMLDVARDMERICPDAWILQAGNPVFDGTTLMSRETEHQGLRPVPRPLWLRRALPASSASTRKRSPAQAPGLNHNIWLTHFLYEGKDAYPLLDDWIENKAEAYWAEIERNKRQGHPRANVAARPSTSTRCTA